MSYLETPFHEFWLKCGNEEIHPADKPFLKNLNVPRGRYKRPPEFKFSVPPCPFDGPLHKARVIVCLANPNYLGLPGDIRKIVLRQRTGNEPLPREWDRWYQQKLSRPIGLKMDELREKTAILNLCPYESKNMEGPEISIAAGLRSVWEAQKYLREVLIPKALKNEIHLVFIRKHALWGITEGWESSNIHVERGQELNGMIPASIAPMLRNCLSSE